MRYLWAGTPTSAAAPAADAAEPGPPAATIPSSPSTTATARLALPSALTSAPRSRQTPAAPPATHRATAFTPWSPITTAPPSKWTRSARATHRPAERSPSPNMPSTGPRARPPDWSAASGSTADAASPPGPPAAPSPPWPSELRAKFIVTGGTGAGDVITCQFTALGAADTTFGNAGVMYQDLGSTSANSNDIGYALLYDPTANSVLICGATTPGGSSTSILGLVEYQDSNKVSIS